MDINRWKVVVVGWREGFRTIDFMRLITSSTAVGLRDAKRMTEELLDDHRLVFSFESEDAARAFAQAGIALGANSDVRSGNDLR